ncbi:retrovirus-related pol polyprotein from transposon TNT 1-94, partial [Tanacetum coccineum]
MKWPRRSPYLTSWLSKLLPSHGYGINVLSTLNFDTINDLAKNDLVTGLPKFKYHKEHLCPSCEQGKSKRASHPPKPVPNSKQRSKDEAPEVIKTFLKRITVLLQSPVIIIRTDNGTEFKNQILKEYFDSVGISHQVSSVRTPQQNRVVEQRNQMLVEAARTIFFSLMHRYSYGLKRLLLRATLKITPSFIVGLTKHHTSSLTEENQISPFYMYSGLFFYPKNDREDIRRLGVKAMYDDYIGGQPSAAPRTTLAAQAPQVIQTPTTSTTIADTALTPTNSSSQATNFPNTSQDVDELETQNNMFSINPKQLLTMFQMLCSMGILIGEPSRPVLTRNQLQSDGDLCVYALTLSTIEPKNVKEAMIDPAWIESMQEE